MFFQKHKQVSANADARNFSVVPEEETERQGGQKSGTIMDFEAEEAQREAERLEIENLGVQSHPNAVQSDSPTNGESASASAIQHKASGKKTQQPSQKHARSQNPEP